METNELSDAVMRAYRTPEARDTVLQMYDSIEAEINKRRPICDISGRCCNFDVYGHKMFITTIELGVFVGRYLTDAKPERDPWNGKSCPFQIGKMCGVHAIRPMGCRLFFCDPTSNQWQNEQYERFHAELQNLHTRLHIPYLYLEWRSALSMLGFK